MSKQLQHNDGNENIKAQTNLHKNLILKGTFGVQSITIEAINNIEAQLQQKGTEYFFITDTSLLQQEYFSKNKSEKVTKASIYECNS